MKKLMMLAVFVLGTSAMMNAQQKEASKPEVKKEVKHAKKAENKEMKKTEAKAKKEEASKTKA